MGTADRIAYVNHDIDDAIRAGILREADLPGYDRTRVLGANHSARIETLVTRHGGVPRRKPDDIAHEPRGVGRHDGAAGVSVRSACTRRPSVMAEVEKATRLRGATCSTTTSRTSDEVPEDYRAISEGDDLRAVTDYIAGMTDRYATATYQRLFIPHALSY